MIRMLYHFTYRMRLIPIEDYQEDLSLASIRFLPPSEDLFNYPDYRPILPHSSGLYEMACQSKSGKSGKSSSSSSSSSSNLQIVVKMQIRCHRYQLFSFCPALILATTASSHDLPPSIEHLVFQEGVPIRIVKEGGGERRENVLGDVSFGSFVIYHENGDIVCWLLIDDFIHSSIHPSIDSFSIISRNMVIPSSTGNKQRILKSPIVYSLLCNRFIIKSTVFSFTSSLVISF